jgi:SAM-dependent methyltransferase
MLAPIFLSAIAIFLSLLSGALPFNQKFDIMSNPLNHRHSEPMDLMRTGLFAGSWDSSNVVNRSNYTSEIQQFAHEIQSACHTGTFVSFSLLGPSSNPPQNFEREEWKHKLRGRIRAVQGRVIELKTKKKTNTVLNKSDLYLQLTLKYHGTTDIAKNWKISNNHLYEELMRLLQREFTVDPEPPFGILQRGELITTERTWILSKRFSSEGSTYQLKMRHLKPTAQTDTKPLLMVAPHDRQKNRPLSPLSPFFIKLGVTNEQGKPRPGMESKLRQCQHFVDTLYGLIDDTIGKSVAELSAVDMGCGRGYLTFALHAFLSDKYDHVNTYGVEIRKELVQEINGIANELGPSFESLKFVQGSIENVRLLDDKIDVLIALHACDTATDDAIFFGIQNQAKVIVTAPCCHKEVRSQLDAYFLSNKENHPYRDILRHPIYREKIAECVTDSLRALLLEIAGYNVKVFEFIAAEHTNKNVMIAATRQSSPRRSPIQLESLHLRLHTLAQMHGIHKQKLARLLAVKLMQSNYDDMEQRKTSHVRYMPPL